MSLIEHDLIAIGGGTAGLVSSAGAAYLGVRSALVERAALGGDCLWTGCVPSKALLASARLAHAMRNAESLGLVGTPPADVFCSVMARMREARERVAHHDDPERFRQMGVDVRFGTARFIGPDRIEVEGVGTLKSKRIIIATGARPTVPPVPGLAQAGYQTHETVFELKSHPARVGILGGGPIGLELAQVFSRLGSEVVVIEMLDRILIKEDPDVGDALLAILRQEGIRIELATPAASVEADGSEKVIVAKDGRRFAVDEIIVATGRQPNTGELNLEAAGIETDGAAVRVDAGLRTTNRGVWAAGDVTGGLQFTHVADYMAKTALRNALLPLRTKADYTRVPWVTYTDPEVAHVGMSAQEAEARGAKTYTYGFDDLDRAITDAHTQGFVKISADRKGRILGATILGHGAGDLLQPIVLAMTHGLSLPKIANTIFPYPTMVEGVKRTADAYQRTRLEGTAGRILKKVIAWLK
jgi:pyruvate/2-oxoglutarate dehydrogenase complex dihydrolipoamide dehydrogenase (E3) component